MCTALAIFDKSILFGRNMDIDQGFNEQVIFLPKDYKIKFKYEKEIKSDYSILGIGTYIDGYPLLADAMNEEGVAFAGLAFKDNCKYYEYDNSKKNYAPYEFVLYILAKCKSIEEIRCFLNSINIVDEPFNKDILNAPLHFIFVDLKESIVVETTNEGMKIYDNPYNILTNNPPFDFHSFNVINYMQLHNDVAENRINKNLNLKQYSYNQGAFGLPGDYSSSSRFIKCFYVKSHLVLDGSKNDINEFFKCLDSVSMVKGSVKTERGFEYTYYTSCYDLKRKKIYYKYYNKPEIKCVSM